jgi:hypothetical protein
MGGMVYNPQYEMQMYDRARHPGQTGDPSGADVEIAKKALLSMGSWIADVIKRDFWGI